MKREDVRAMCESLGIRVTSTIHGFDFAAPDLEDGRVRRLVTGGGIAGNAGAWRLEWKSGEAEATRLAHTRTELRRLLIEELAGPRPPDRSGYTLHAKMHKYGLGEHAVWCYRRA